MKLLGMDTFRLLCGVCALVVLGALQPLYAQAEQKAASAESISLAIRRLDSTAPTDWKQSESELLDWMKDPSQKARVTLALAMFHVRSGNVAAIERFRPKINTIFGNPKPECNAALLRIQLWHDLASEQPVAAAEHFVTLIDGALDRNLSKASRLACAAMLGAIVGTFDLPAAESPIAPELLASAKSRLEATKDAEVAIAFKSKYEVSLALATGFADWFERNAGVSPEDAVQICEGELTALRAELADHQQTVLDATQESKLIQGKTGRDNINKRTLTQNVNNLEAFWRLHPELHNPIQPDRSRIVVDEYETVSDGYENVRVQKTRTVYDADGNRKQEKYDEWERKEKHRKVERSQADIDREIDGIYRNLMNAYQFRLVKRKELLDSHAELRQQLRQLEGELGSDEARKADSKAALKAESDEKKRVRFQMQIITAVLDLARLGHTEPKFRPPYIAIFDYSLEEKVLAQ